MPAVLLCLLLLAPSQGRAEEGELPPLPKGPLILTSVTPDQFDPDYWIRRIPGAENPIKTPQELKEFNEEIDLMVAERQNIFALDPSRSGSGIRSAIEQAFKTLKNRILYDRNNATVPDAVFDDKIKPVLGTDKIPATVKLQWGAAIRAASVRALPSDILMMEKPNDPEFDMLQFTQIKPWTPVGILHTSTDKAWYYVQAPYARGWVRSRDIALFPSRGELKKFAQPSDFLVVTAESIPLYSDPELSAVVLRASMGTVLPLSRFDGKTGAHAVWIPVRKSTGGAGIEKAYVAPGSDVTRGFMPFSQANIIRQAFKLLGARYGWGGTYNGRDCSGFTHDVFLSLGVDMPRDSKYQSIIGTQISAFEPYHSTEEKTQALRACAPGMTLIKMPSHMMLYLGEVNGQFYVIHSTWAERYSKDSDAKNRINQVVVSDLTLNGKSYLGSLFDRITAINEVN